MPRTLIGNFKGPKGDTGAQGIQGYPGPQGLQGEKGDPGTVDENTPITFEIPEEYETPASGNAIKVLFGKITKGLSNLFDAVGVLASLKTVEKSTLVAAVNELADGKFDAAKLVASTNITEPGFAMDGKTASEAFAELYSNQIRMKKYTVRRQFTANTDGGNRADINIDVNAKEIIGVIPIMRGGVSGGIFQASIRVLEVSTNSFSIQVVPDMTQVYELDVFVFWR